MDIQKLLERGDQLEARVRELFEMTPSEILDREIASSIMCSVALEHANSFRLLSHSGNYTSAISLCRLQYETMVRALWLFYAASEEAVAKITSVLTSENENKANSLPMLSEMLKSMSGKAPQAALDMLEEFKKYSWKSLSSFVHGGIHALNRHAIGYPEILLDQIIRMSNALNTMTGMMLAILSGDQRIVTAFSRIQPEFADCLPELK
tara:strand:- start:1814 stop:2437 length:624 start_codon:yes stop_codon:yes gene_type:complete